jgi:hypothetical protein
MKSEEYARIIWYACSVGWLMVWLPCLLYLSVAWRRGSHGLFPVFRPSEIKSYYEQFLRNENISGVGDDELKRRFEGHFARMYGRRRYILPFLLLTCVAGIGTWATAKTIQAWQLVSLDQFKFPAIAVSAYVGALTWVINDQFSRLRNRDLTFHDVYKCVFRLLIALPFGFSFAAWAAPEFGVPVAFLLGTFPTGTLIKVGRRLAVQQFKLGEDATEASNELEKLQCVSRSSAERFMDEGINTIAELAWSDPVDLTLRTNKEFDYVIDCASQALVWVYFEDKTKDLYKLSLRTAHEVTSLIYTLDSSDSDKRTQAKAVLAEASNILGMSTTGLLHTLRQIEEDPFVRFLVAVWHWPVKKDSPEGVPFAPR